MLFYMCGFDFLAKLSQKLKWVFLIKISPLSVFVIVAVVNISHFHLLLQNHWANFNKTWHKASLDKEDSSLFIWRAHRFLRRDSNEITKIYWQNKKNHRINFNQTWQKASFGTCKGIPVCSYKGPTPFQRGDNNEIAKYIDKI